MTSDTLHVATISKADHWVEHVLPRFVAYVRSACSGNVRSHLLLLADDVKSDDTANRAASARKLFDNVVVSPFVDHWPQRRLLTFDFLRAGLTATFGVDQLLYLDPDTDVIADLQGVQHVAPEAELLWVSNPVPLQPVIKDLRRHGFLTTGDDAAPWLVEPGCLFLRRDFTADYAALVKEFPDVHPFVPGSTYWNMLVRRLGDRAVRLPDAFNRTFWDIAGAVSTARTVHYTGQWKHLLPFVSYDRPGRRAIIHDRPAPLPAARALPRTEPAALNVIMMVRDNAAWLRYALQRFESWENAGLPVRYHILENDSTDDTATMAASFLRERRGHLESRRLATRPVATPRGTNYDRIMPLARMRNHITDIAMRASPLDPDEWTLLLDSDIYFPSDVCQQVFTARSSDPNPQSLGMLTVYAQQLFDPTNVPNIGEPAADMPGLATADHYYDTYAFQDLEHQTQFPLCAFERCRRCRAVRPVNVSGNLIRRDRAIVDVASAFGGFALIPTTILRDSRIRWSTYSFGLDRLRVLSEHVMFCERLRTVSGRRVVVLQSVDRVYRR